MNQTFKNETILTENVVTPHHHVNQVLATAHNTLQVEIDSSQKQQQQVVSVPGDPKNNQTLNSAVGVIDQGFNSKLEHNLR